MKKFLATILCLGLLMGGLVFWPQSNPLQATIATETTRNTYSGNGTVFPYTFKIFAKTDLLVIVRDASGNETPQVVDSDYTVSGVGVDAGGNVTFTVAPASTETILILRNRPLKQETSYSDTGPFLAKSHEDALDELTMLVQQLQEQLDRSIHIKKSSALTDLEFSEFDAGEYVRVNASGDGLDSTDAVYDLGNFLQSGTGAVSRTAASKMGEIVSVTDFAGVDPTGVIDSTMGFQSAQTRAGAEGKVNVPAGTYLVKDLAITTLVDGVGKATVIKAYDDTTNGIVTFGAPSGQLKNCTIDGNTGGGKTAVGAYFSANGWDSKLENVRFINLGSYPVHINDCNHVEIKGCRFEGGTTYMIYGDKADNLLVDHCIFQTVTVTNAIRLVYTGGADAGSNATIRNSWFEFDNASAKVTVPIYAAVQRVSVIDNKFIVTSNTQTAQVHFADESGGGNARGDEGYLARNTFQTVAGANKEFVIDTNVTLVVAEWNHAIAAASQFTDNGTGSLIRSIHPTTGLLMQWGDAAPWYRTLATVTDTWNPGSIAVGAMEAKDVTVTGAALGDWAMASLSIDLTDLVLDAQVTLADTVTCVLSNNTAGAVDLGAATVYVKVFDRAP